MSIPISTCLVAKAVKNEESYQELLKAMKINKTYGHWSYIPCSCATTCIASAEEIDKLNDRLEKDLEGIVCELDNGPEGPSGERDKVENERH